MYIYCWCVFIPSTVTVAGIDYVLQDSLVFEKLIILHVAQCSAVQCSAAQRRGMRRCGKLRSGADLPCDQKFHRDSQS